MDTLNRHRPLILGGLAVVLLLGFGGYYLWNTWGGGAGKPAYLLAASGFPPHAARVVGKELSPLTIPEQGSATLYDSVRTDGYEYVLLSGPEANQSTLYRKDLEKPDAGLEQLTTSPGLKIDLSTVSVGNVLAYTVQDTDGSTQVSVWEARTKEEKSLGAGSEPTVLADGDHVVLRRGTTLVSVSVSTGEASELVTLSEDALFAVDRSTSQISVYDPEKRTINQYWIENMTTAVAGDVTEPTQVPQALTYDHGKLVLAAMVDNDLTLWEMGEKDPYKVIAPGLSLTGLSLTYYHHD
jgi:hypothetical protein